MRWHVPVVAGLLLLGACTSDESPAPSAAGELIASTTQSVQATQSTSTAAPEPKPEPQTEAITIDVLWELDTTIGPRIDELANYGYGLRPSTSPDRFAVPDLRASIPTLEVRHIDVAWGIDSTALVVTAVGTPDVVEQAEALLADSTPWVTSDQEWVVALYRGGLAADFEMETMVERITWIMYPDDACQKPDAVCPDDGDGPAEFPLAPPNLLVNADTSSAPTGSIPFEVTLIESASSFDASRDSLLWIDGENAFSSWGDIADASTVQQRGPATVATGVGCFAFVVDPTPTTDGRNVLALRDCAEPTNRSIWPIPAGWTIDGLALTGNFQQGDYGLVATVALDANRRTAITIPLGERFFDDTTSPHTVHLDELEHVNPLGRPWSLPRRNTVGDLLVVEERIDGWYLIDDALTEPRDLLRSSHPIRSHTADAGNRHIVMVIEGPEGPSTWWIHDQETTKLIGDATAVSWLGFHSVWDT